MHWNSTLFSFSKFLLAMIIVLWYNGLINDKESDMGFFSWLFNRNKRNKSPELRRYLGSDTETHESEEIIEETPKKKKKRYGVASAASKPHNNVITSVDQNTNESSEDVSIAKTSGFFDIKKSRDNRFVFNLYASNKVLIACSRVYSSSKSALGGVKSVIATAEKASFEDKTKENYVNMPFPKWEIYKDKAKQFRFRLMAANGTCICRSQGYKSKASCKNGIESIIRSVKNAKVDKSYLKKQT